MKAKNINKNGVILHEDAERVVIATGLKSKSGNAKTGGMIQVWILYRHARPIDASRMGLDACICGNCIHRGLYDPATGLLIPGTRRCYVNLGQGPNSVYACYARGGYRHATADEYATLFGGRKVRWGAYGDPFYIPREIIEAVSAVCEKHTGYTHQWMHASASFLRAYVMASCDSEAEAEAAEANGWRVFRVRSKNAPVRKGEVVCPASKEGGKRSLCEKCMYCDGKRYGETDPRKAVVIIDHSVIRNTRPLIQIQAA